MLSGEWELNKVIFCKFFIPESCSWRPPNFCFYYYWNKNPTFHPEISFFKYFNVFLHIANDNNFVFLNVNNNSYLFKFNNYILLNMKWNFNINICNKFWITLYYHAFVKLLMVYSVSSKSFNQISTLGLCFDL